MTKNRTPTPVYLDPGMHPGLEVKGLISAHITLYSVVFTERLKLNTVHITLNAVVYIVYILISAHITLYSVVFTVRLTLDTVHIILHAVVYTIVYSPVSATD